MGTIMLGRFLLLVALSFVACATANIFATALLGKRRDSSPMAVPAASFASGDRMVAFEHTLMRRWNQSDRTFLLLGQKVWRDFSVYKWAFDTFHIRIVSPPQGVVLLSATKGFPDAGALLCHSLFLSNCVRSPSKLSRGAIGDIYTSTYRYGAKINRVAAVREALSTKDGLCRTLGASGLTPEAIWNFSFPCWTLPDDGVRLAQQLDSRLPNPDGSGRAPAWIVKPARGSQGQGIRVFHASAELAARLHASASLQARTKLVVQPYLREPKLHRGRKWDLRTYVLVTSVLPMRVYVFAEAIVRYASSAYSPNATTAGSVLTNTYVGKQLLHGGVRSITGLISDLCSEVGDLPGEGAGEGEGESAPLQETALRRSATPAAERYLRAARQRGREEARRRCTAAGLNRMREAISQLFLAAEPRLQQLYHDEYSSDREASSPQPPSRGDEGEGTRDGRGRSPQFRCAGCYHLLGVDLIAGEDGRMHVIEVNVSPDLSLSTQGACGRSAGAPSCGDGSVAYDHTKLAAAYNTVQLVYSRDAVAADVEHLLQRHARNISALELLLQQPTPRPSTTQQASQSFDAAQRSAALPPAELAPMLQPDVAEYVLDLVRERRSAGCFIPVYPTLCAHRDHNYLLQRLAGSDERRMQWHTLLGIVLADLDGSQRVMQFRHRCEQMLKKVPRVRQGSWARRTHIFKDVWDLPP